MNWEKQLLATVFPDGEFHPCPFDAECWNCGHPMRGHFRENRSAGYATACGACPCNYWYCQHGGTKTSGSKRRRNAVG